MAARFARGRFRAACVVGLLAWLAAASSTPALRAQETADDWPTVDDTAATSWDEFDRDGGWGCSDCDSCECGDTCCDGSYARDCGCCFAGMNPQQWWFGAELLFWRMDGAQLPPLLTENQLGFPPTLALASTDVLAGGNVTGDSWRTGYRLELGVWFDDCQETALVGDYFNIGQDDYDYFYPGGSGTNVGRPYFDTQGGVQFYRPISGIYGTGNDQIIYDGTVGITYDDEFQGAGLWVQQRVYMVGDASGNGPSTQVMVLGGYRFLSYDSQLRIDDSRTVVSGTGAGGREFRRDLFDTDNEFHGAEFGVMARFTQTGCWFDGLAKLAIGGQKKQASINGSSVLIPGMVPSYEEGGWLTSPDTNIGNYRDYRARFVPTFRLGAGVRLTPQWTFQVGYTAIVWGGVVRAAALTPPNLAVDTRNIPPVSAGGGPAPVFPGLGGSELVAHGLDLGIEYRY